MHFKILFVFAFTLHIYWDLYKATNLYLLFTIIFYWSKATFMVYLKKLSLSLSLSLYIYIYNIQLYRQCHTQTFLHHWISIAVLILSAKFEKSFILIDNYPRLLMIIYLHGWFLWLLDLWTFIAVKNCFYYSSVVWISGQSAQNSQTRYSRFYDMKILGYKKLLSLLKFYKLLLF